MMAVVIGIVTTPMRLVVVVTFGVSISVSPIGFVSVIHFRVWEKLSILSLSIVQNWGYGITSV
jgi:hypothetical protein